MLTIGQLAAYAGVTVRAVRHYHRRGLLAEPPRDASGYRRYGAEHAIALVKIRTLAQAGVPLARVKELLAGDPQRLASALVEIDRGVRSRIAELEQTRERLRRLGAGDRLFVSTEVAAHLERLRALGVSPRGVQSERDVWILLEGALPAAAAAWIADKRAAMDDPEFRTLYLEHDAAFAWPADDPRLDGLAGRTLRWMASQPARPADQAPDSTIAQLVASSPGATSPGWERLAALIRERSGAG